MCGFCHSITVLVTDSSHPFSHSPGESMERGLCVMMTVTHTSTLHCTTIDYTTAAAATTIFHHVDKHQHAASYWPFYLPLCLCVIRAICLTLGSAHWTVPRQAAGGPPRPRRPLPVEWADNGGVTSSLPWGRAWPEYWQIKQKASAPLGVTMEASPPSLAPPMGDG